MSGRENLSVLLTLLLCALFLPPSVALADQEISTPGDGAGQTDSPQGLAVDSSNGRLYVVDAGNRRVDVFTASGAFEKAFGWGVQNGNSELQTCTTACQKGIPGSGPGQFSGSVQINAPSTIAVDDDPLSPSFHDVYVSDRGNGRIQKFDEDGDFLLAFGAPGTGPGQLSPSERVSIGVGPSGVVYVVDTFDVEGGGKKSRLQKFSDTGSFIEEIVISEADTRSIGLAVESGGGFLVTTQVPGRIRKFAADGSILKEVTGQNLGSLMIDAVNNVFARELEEPEPGSGFGVIPTIVEYDSDLNPSPLRRFGYNTLKSSPVDLAFHESETGDIYASEGDRVLHIGIPAPGPISMPCGPTLPVGSVSATINAMVNPEGKATTYHLEYLTEEQFEAGGFGNPETIETTETPLPGGPDFKLHLAQANISGLQPETKYYCRVVAANTDAPGGVSGPEGSFETKETVEVLGTWSSDVEAESAIFGTRVNPLGTAAEGYFEYVDDATFKVSGFDAAERVPLSPATLNFGAGATPVTREESVEGLAPGTLYHYRVVVDNALISEPKEGLAQTLRTFGEEEELPPDGRRYEMVSPPQKNSAEVGAPGPREGLANLGVAIQASSSTGEAITYTAFNSFAEPEGAPAVSQYFSDRRTDGWSTKNVSPPGFQHVVLHSPYRGFTPDLGFAGVVVSEPPLTDECHEGFEGLYLRNNATQALQCLTTEAPTFIGSEEGPYCTGYAGASDDGTRAFFAADAAFAGAPEEKGFSLYEWSQGGGLTLVSILPDGSPAPSKQRTAFGGGNPGSGGNCATGSEGGGLVPVLGRAISNDGAVAIWRFAGSYEGSSEPLFARIHGSETVQLDANAGGAGPGGEGRYLTATADGSYVFFTTPNSLAPGAGSNGLYRYDIETREVEHLTAGPEAVGTRGLVGISENGASAYFVADGVLDGAASDGEPNLYLWREGEGVHFIATLDNGDSSSWTTNPISRQSRVTADGLHVAFTSVATEALSGYDNTDQTTGNPDPEVYLYDAAEDKLSCASCNPSGGRPAGPSSVPVWSNPYEGPRYLSEGGQRIFFESLDALTPGDDNGKRDVYEAQRPGSGSCTPQSRAFSPESDFCIYRISTARSSDESYLLDASATGRDVFFSTRDRLVGWDRDENYDIYNARVGGGFAEPQDLPPPCEGDSCRGPSSAPPPSPATPTNTFVGPGNPKAKQAKPKAGKKKQKKNHGKKSGKKKSGKKKSGKKKSGKKKSGKKKNHRKKNHSQRAGGGRR